jgi:hypothetical protein
MNFDWHAWFSWGASIARTWGSWAISAGVGASALKGFQYLYGEWRHSRQMRESARQIIDQHLDPILKAADDLVGKLQSVAAHDFQEFRRMPNPADGIAANIELTNILYLFGQFWSRIQILRQEALYVNLSADPRGERLRSFLEMLERRGIGIVDRPYQRAMGEALIRSRARALHCISYYSFAQIYLSNQSAVQDWFHPLRDSFSRVDDRSIRQRILLYGSVLHAMIDTLDAAHRVTSERPGWANKLTKKSRAELRFRVFANYLPFVADVAKYAGTK